MQPIDNPASLALPETPMRYSMPPLLWGPAGLAAAAKPLTWLWQGFLAPGAVTLMTSQWKAGKTTLASVLLARMQTGGVFAGRPLAVGKAIVVSEEGPELWHLRHGKLAFGDHIGWYCRPFRGKPKPEMVGLPRRTGRPARPCALLPAADRPPGGLSARQRK